MIIDLDMASETPIYIQLRNQIVLGIGQGKLQRGEQLPTVRQLASDMGVNTMTVNKGYQILKTEGFIEIDRRYGARISETVPENQEFKEKLETQLELLAAEAKVRGMEQEELEELCKNIFKQFRLA